MNASPSLHTSQMKKRYYDTWETNNDEVDSLKNVPFRHKGSNKDDPCENKPLWFLKSQRKLGKFSPFHNCLNELE